MRLPALVPDPPKLRDEALVVLDPSLVVLDPPLVLVEAADELVDVDEVEDTEVFPEPEVVVLLPDKRLAAHSPCSMPLGQQRVWVALPG